MSSAYHIQRLRSYGSGHGSRSLPIERRIKQCSGPCVLCTLIDLHVQNLVRSERPSPVRFTVGLRQRIQETARNFLNMIVLFAPHRNERLSKHGVPHKIKNPSSAQNERKSFTPGANLSPCDSFISHHARTNRSSAKTPASNQPQFSKSLPSPCRMTPQYLTSSLPFLPSETSYSTRSGTSATGPPKYGMLAVNMGNSCVFVPHPLGNAWLE